VFSGSNDQKKVIPMSLAVAKQFEMQYAKGVIEEFREFFGLNYVEIAAVLGVDRRTLLRYRNQVNAPSPKVLERLETLIKIAALINKVFVNREEGIGWICAPVPLPRHRRPIDSMQCWKIDEVLALPAGQYSGPII